MAMQYTWISITHLLESFGFSLTNKNVTDLLGNASRNGLIFILTPCSSIPPWTKSCLTGGDLWEPKGRQISEVYPWGMSLVTVYPVAVYIYRRRTPCVP